MGNLVVFLSTAREQRRKFRCSLRPKPAPTSSHQKRETTGIAE